MHYVIFSCATPNSDVCGDQCLAGSHGRYCGLKTCLAGSSGWVDPKSGVAAPCVSGDKVVMEDLRQMCILNTTAGASVRGSNNEPFANPFYLYYLKRFNENCYNASSRGFGPSGEMNFVPNETCFSDQFVAATANAYARSVGGAAFGPNGLLGIGLDDADALRLDVYSSKSHRTEPHQGRGRNIFNFENKLDSDVLRGATAKVKAGGSPIARYEGPPEESKGYLWSCLGALAVSIVVCGVCAGCSGLVYFDVL